MMSRQVRIVVLFALAICAGCAARTPAEVAIHSPDASIEDYEQALRSNEDRLREEGIVASPADPRETPPPAEPNVTGAAETVDAYKDAEDTPTMESRATKREHAASAPASEMGPRERNGRRDRSDQRDDERCDRICDLAEAICELQAHIHALARRHVGNPRYETACQRADDQCRLASAACSHCSGD